MGSHYMRFAVAAYKAVCKAAFNAAGNKPQSKYFRVVALHATVLFGSVSSAFVVAQEGHPYEGTWRGTATAGAESLPVVIIMNYDGESLKGMVNPGRNSFPFTSVEHDAPRWFLNVAATNKQNEAIRFAGVMHEIGSPHRYIDGTWTQAGKEYSFRITRE
jgi:hypothetical protein